MADSLENPWCWERLGAGGEGDDRDWDGWMASPNWWTWVWVNSGSWWWTGGLACCDSWGHKESDRTKRLNWTEPIHKIYIYVSVYLGLCSHTLHCRVNLHTRSNTLLEKEWDWIVVHSGSSLKMLFFRELCLMLCDSWMGREFGGQWIHVYAWLCLLLSTWNHHNIIHQLYSNSKFLFKCNF